MKNAAILDASLFSGKTRWCFGSANKADIALAAAGGLAQAVRPEGIAPPLPDFLWSLLFYEASVIRPLSGSKYRKFAP
jgi:hypothetical protein